MTLRWNDVRWQGRIAAEIDEALELAGRPRTGVLVTEKAWGRSCLHIAPTEAGTVWIKHGYELPPGEERVVSRLAERWPDRVPRVVTWWAGSLATEPLGGRELDPEDPLEDWTDAARVLGELAAGEEAHVDEWLELGVRDRRAHAWPDAVDALVESPVVAALDDDLRRDLDDFVPEFRERYVNAFVRPATLVPQDSGSCNIHVTDTGPVFVDWADVVVGHPVFSCDRLLDQVSGDRADAVIDAFREPLGMTRPEFNAMRRSNVLHEVLRYHDELAYIPDGDPSHQALRKSVQSQLGVLIRFEKRRS